MNIIKKVKMPNSYYNYPKFSDKALANSAKPDLIKVFIVCHSICIFLTTFSMEGSLSLNFGRLQQTFWMSENLGILQYLAKLSLSRPI